mmetsp:Transcript_26853/g.30735  ORF Transcript_26853/g.30735 Transcript_26853/m.30735 type:complete len:684 (+) Transcript_26853:19-2070(+)
MKESASPSSSSPPETLLSLALSSVALSSEKRNCDGCKELAYKDKDGNFLKMLRCSRCKNAWYHNVSCQRRHYKEHKDVCRKISSTTISKTVKNSNKNSLDKSSMVTIPSYRCEISNINNRGRCMNANKKLKKGSRIHPSESKKENFQPIVPPVLFLSERKSRCALCFGKLPTSIRHVYTFSNTIKNEKEGYYSARFCSQQCREEAKLWNLDKELETIHKIESTSTSKFYMLEVIAPALLLLHRIVCKILKEESQLHQRQSQNIMESTRMFMSQLVSDDHVNVTKSTNDNNKNNTHISVYTIDNKERCRQHEQIIEITLQLLNAQTQFNHHHHPPHNITKDILKTMVSQIDLNGFSISDVDNKTIGLGLYIQGSIMNHSCQPNLIQTFSYGINGQLLSLLITASKDISQNEEMCISYIDLLQDTAIIRMKRLMKEYRFQCDCLRCVKTSPSKTYETMDDIDDVFDDYDDLSGILYCSTEGCSGLCHDKVMRKQCKICNVDCFDSVLKLRNESFQIVQDISSSTTSSTSTTSSGKKYASEDMTVQDHIMIVDQLEETYKTLKRCCHISSSYVQSSGTLLVDWLINSIDGSGTSSTGSGTRDDTMKLCSRAFSISNEVIKHCKEKHSPLAFLTTRMIRAKLSLYLYPDPRHAIVELQEIRTELLVYYPKHHETIFAVEELLKSAYQ